MTTPADAEILDGEPTAEEVAAVMVVLAALRPATEPAATPVASAWSDRSAGMRTAWRPGPGAWRLSSRR